LPNWIVALAALYGVIVAVGTLRAILDQARIANSSLGEARKSSDAVKRQAEILVENFKHQRLYDRIQHAQSSQSLEIAQLALTAEKPYVFVESQKLRVFNARGIGAGYATSLLTRGTVPDEEATYAEIDLSFTLRNRGKGIAKIEDVRMRLLSVPDPFQAAGLWMSKGGVTVEARYSFLYNSQVIIGGEEESESYSTFVLYIPIANWRAMNVAGRAPMVIVRAVYADVFERSYIVGQTFRYSHEVLIDDPVRRRRKKEKKQG